MSLPRGRTWPRIKLGWVLLVLLFLYSVIVTSAWLRAQSQAGAEPSEPEAAIAASEAGLWFPIVGARLPQTASYLPGSPRAYRRGVNQGFDFHDGDVGVPVVYGTPVIAAARGTVVRADRLYRELNPEEWQALIASVGETGADEAQLDRLRGRQIYLETDDGHLLRYGHLSAVRAGISAGTRVYRGQVIGFVGNSGTLDGVRDNERSARLHFEVWEPGGSFFGEGLDEQSLRLRAASLFVGP